MKRLMKGISVFFIAVFFAFAAGNAAEANGSCVYKGEIYYSIYNKLYKLNPSTKKTKLIKTVPNVWTADPFAVSGGKVYLTVDSFIGTGAEDYSIYSLDLKTKKMKKLAKGTDGILKGNYIYYIQSKYVDEAGVYGDKGTGISRVKKNGSGKKKLYSGNVSVYNGLTAHKGRLYFYENNYKSVKLNGKGVRKEAGVLTDKNYVYYKENNNRNGLNVYRQRIGSSTKKLVAELADVTSIDVYNDTLYYVKLLNSSYPGKGAVYKKNLKTGKTKKIYSGNGIRYVSHCGRWLFLTKYLDVSGSSPVNTQYIVITTSGKKVKSLQKYFVS